MMTTDELAAVRGMLASGKAYTPGARMVISTLLADVDELRALATELAAYALNSIPPMAEGWYERSDRVLDQARAAGLLP